MELKVKFDEVQLREIVNSAIKDALSTDKAAYLNKAKTAEYFGVSPVTIWKWQKAGKITPVLVGDRQMFLKADLEKFAQGIPLKA